MGIGLGILGREFRNCHSIFGTEDSVTRKFLITIYQEDYKAIEHISPNLSRTVSTNMRSLILIAITNLIGAISGMSIPKPESHAVKQERQTDPCLRTYGPCDPLRFQGDCCSNDKGFIFCNAVGAVQFQACIVPANLGFPPLICLIDPQSGLPICGSAS